MVTNKKRINISLTKEIDFALDYLAQRDQVPQATKAAELIRVGLELDEDEVLNSLAERRDRKTIKFVSHKNAWA